MTEASFYLGIDAGGSRCKARLVNKEMQMLAEVESGPANARIGVDRLTAILVDIAESALKKADLPLTELANVIAGIGDCRHKPPKACAWPLRTWRFPTDAVHSIQMRRWPALGHTEGANGAILVLGTGSTAYIKNGSQAITIGGYGFPISDEGSGAALGLSGVRHALRALDGRTKATPLSAAISKQFDNDTTRAIAWMDQATPYDYGAFAPLVLDFAEEDDEIARSIVEDAAKHVERFIETIFAKGAQRCALVGGLAARMTPWLRRRTTKQACCGPLAMDWMVRFCWRAPIACKSRFKSTYLSQTSPKTKPCAFQVLTGWCSAGILSSYQYWGSSFQEERPPHRKSIFSLKVACPFH